MSSNYWSQYWQEGRLSSFGDEPNGNYQGPTKDVWLEFFANIKADDLVLDIATGNGALIALALEAGLGDEKTKFVGVDYAKLKIQNVVLTDNPSVTFYDQTRAEQLPLEESSTSLVVSQYGLEYTDIAKTVAELRRVVRPGGRFQFICHTSDSMVLKINRDILRAARIISEPGGILETARKLVGLLDKTNNKGTPGTEKLRNKLNGLIGKQLDINERAFHSTNFPDFLSRLFGKSRPANRKDMVDQFAEENRGLIERLEDLQHAALSEQRLEALQAHLRNNHFTIQRCEPFFQRTNEVVGVLLRGEAG